MRDLFLPEIVFFKCTDSPESQKHAFLIISCIFTNSCALAEIGISTIHTDQKLHGPIGVHAVVGSGTGQSD